ncbi:MAG: histidine-type phosphatase [Bacteroidales bacterium]|nr:histidine-type phosphatase [Bacteroidales bacterium]
MNRFLLGLALFLVGAVSAKASDKYSGIYHLYPTPQALSVKAPKGYEAFYLSHYGRHGSRWMLEKEEYTKPYQTLEDAYNAGALTPRGVEVYEIVRECYKDGLDREGELTPLGERQHYEIASRMAANFPKIFAKSAKVDARSTIIVRCVLSMASACDALRDYNPRLVITRSSSNRNTRILNFFYKFPDSPMCKEYLDYMAAGPWKAMNDSLIRARVNSKDIIDPLFSDKEYLKGVDTHSLGKELFKIAKALPNTELPHRLWDLFTPEQLDAYGVAEDLWFYTSRGPHHLTKGYPQEYSMILIEDFVAKADGAIDGTNPNSADLRFGHDGDIMAFLPQMRMNGYDERLTDPDEISLKWSVALMSPMAANLQLVFFRPKHKKATADNVLVLALMNEVPATFPLEQAAPGLYRWSDLKKLFLTPLN